MAIADVALQLKERCQCLQNCELSEVESVANELIRMLSLSACWTRDVCETLLTSQRTELIPMPCRKCGCCGNIERFTPYYSANVDDVEVYVITQRGLVTERVRVDHFDVAVTEVFGYPEILVDLSNYAKSCSCRTCDNMTLEFVYTAGYDSLPECLFPEVCELVKTITASKSGCGGLDECCAMSQPEVGYVLKTKKVGELSWSWTQDQTSIDYIYNQLYISGKLKSLGMISLCGTESDEYSSLLWAVSKKPNYGGDNCGTGLYW